MRGLAAALCAFSIVASAQDDPLAWFPLRVGSRWVYEHEWKSGDRNRPDVERWSSEETITGWVKIPEGIVVLRDAKRRISSDEQSAAHRTIGLNGGGRSIHQPDNAHGAYIITRAKYPYLIHRNCIYLVSSGWDAQKQDLQMEYRKYLNEGSVSPELCFPLQPGREWGNKDIPWRVEPARHGAGTLLPARHAEAIHIFSSHYGSGGWEDVWFKKSIGVVEEHYIHNGTYDEYTKKLVSFSH